MVLFFICTMLVSIAGLVSLLVIKRWELETGNILFGGIRPVLGEKMHSTLMWVERALPGIISGYSRRTGRRVQETLHRKVAEGLLAAEHGLEHVLGQLRGMTEHPKSNKPASDFLREVAEHKRQLLSSKQAEALAEAAEIREE